MARGDSALFFWPRAASVVVRRFSEDVEPGLLSGDVGLPDSVIPDAFRLGEGVRGKGAVTDTFDDLDDGDGTSKGDAAEKAEAVAEIDIGVIESDRYSSTSCF